MKKFKKYLHQEKNNKKIDSFLNGVDGIKKGSSKNAIHPKIKIPVNAGYNSFFQSNGPVFMYPNFPQFRQYQYKIALECVTYNTLVCLPTGLGKTHIASVLIANFINWFPEGKIFFLAPTRPLVDQQSASLSKFSRFVNQKDIFQMTGKIVSSKRIAMYESKKIFFSTPQTFENDLRQNRIQSKKIVLVIFDEAHRGVGDYSYTKIVKLMDKNEVGFRIVGLSATPGSSNQKIQQVITNLHISKLIVKNEDDKDVSPYIMSKSVKQIVIKATDIIIETQKILDNFMELCTKCLIKFQIFPKYLLNGKYGLTNGILFQIRQYIQENKSKIQIKYRGFVYESLKYLSFLTQSKQALRQSGYNYFKQRFLKTIEENQEPEIQGIQDLKKEFRKQENEEEQSKSMSQKSSSYSIPNSYWKCMKESEGLKRVKRLFQRRVKVEVHPKIDKLRELLLQFFNDEKNIENNSKVIIFANLRSTCFEIKSYINKEKVIKSELFLGQAKTTIQTISDNDEEVTQTLQLSQRQQKKLIYRYKNNEINTLISTSIGEQGLDIGQVDAIFCYDGGLSVIRLIQRMGRTGRKRNGNVYMLLMDGKEYEDYNKTIKKSQIIKKMKNVPYQYYGFNSSLFQDCTMMPIQFYGSQKADEKQKGLNQCKSDEGKQVSKIMQKYLQKPQKYLKQSLQQKEESTVEQESGIRSQKNKTKPRLKNIRDSKGKKQDKTKKKTNNQQHNQYKQERQKQTQQNEQEQFIRYKSNEQRSEERMSRFMQYTQSLQKIQQDYSNVNQFQFCQSHFEKQETYSQSSYSINITDETINQIMEEVVQSSSSSAQNNLSPLSLPSPIQKQKQDFQSGPKIQSQIQEQEQVDSSQQTLQELANVLKQEVNHDDDSFVDSEDTEEALQIQLKMTNDHNLKHKHKQDIKNHTK